MASGKVAERGGLPLQGVRALVLGYVIAGPMTGRFLANYGADVIRIEWTGHLDRLRHGAPSKRSVKTVNSSGRFGQYNSEVKSIGVDLRSENGRRVFRDLLGQSDILVTNLGAHVLPALGFPNEAIFEANPKLVVARLTLFGEGRYQHQPGLGGGLAAYSGFFESTGWPDGDPVMPQGAYTDFIAPPLAATAILAALEEAAASGRGRVIDVSQFELGSWFLMPQLLASQLADEPAGREGSFSDGPGISFACPCLGDDRWCTVTLVRDEQWSAFCEAIGQPEARDDSRFSTAHGRFLHRWELVERVSSWTQDVTREELIALCRGCGVLAVPLADGADLQADPYLAARGHWREVERCDNGRAAYSERFPVSLRAPEEIVAFSRRASDFGEHTYELVRDLLGYEEQDVSQLYQEGTLE